jgi:GT2 family glycosyltransferase
MLHIVIICGSEQHVLFECLASLQNQGVSLNITVIDDASVIDDSDTFERISRGFGHCELIRNPTRRGFATNCNMGLRAIPRKAEYALLLNDDTIVRERALKQLISAMQSDQRIGAANPLLLNPDGTEQWSEQQLRFPNEWLTTLQIVIGHKLASMLSRGAYSSSWLSGACLMLRASAIREVGGFDEGFDPGYGEDVDLCYRLRLHGWQLMTCREAKVTHIGGMSFKAGSVGRHAYRFQGYLQYMAKWGSRPQQVCTKLAWWVSIVGRIVVSVCLHGAGIRSRLAPPSAYLAMLKGYAYALRHART